MHPTRITLTLTAALATTTVATSAALATTSTTRPNIASRHHGGHCAHRKPIRFATFNVSLNRRAAGALVTELSDTEKLSDQAKVIAETIQRVNADVILLNEFDYDEQGVAINAFRTNYLQTSQNGQDPINYRYVYFAPVNTGVPSGQDLDRNGKVEGPGDAFGFGFFPGQYGMVILSKHPILTPLVRTFQNFLWKDMPGALLPDAPDSAQGSGDWYSPQALDVFRLSSKSHWDVPVWTPQGIMHVLASHPTPPVFDGDEDRNGRRNHDEIRFWRDYVRGGFRSWYIYDDNGFHGGLWNFGNYVLMGDLNADPNDGDSTNNPIQMLIDSRRFNTSVIPSSDGAAEASERQGGSNENQNGDPSQDTADFSDRGPGNLRVDYVLPAHNLKIKNAGVFWPTQDDPTFSLVGEYPFPGSDHRAVYVDVKPKRHRWRFY